MERAAGPWILIADGDTALCQHLSTRLLPLEIHTDCAGTVGDAFDKIGARAYALVVLDVALPGGDVERVVRRIARLERAEQPIVLVLARDARAARTMDVDIVQIVLRKPVDLLQILDLISSCVRSTVAAAAPAALPDRTSDQLRP